VARARFWSDELLAAYTAGLPAVTRHAPGAGAAWYLSTLLAADDLAALLHGIAAAAGIAPAPPGVSVTRRRDEQGRSWLCAVSRAATPVTLPACGLDLLAGREVPGSLDLPPGGIAIVREAGAAP